MRDTIDIPAELEEWRKGVALVYVAIGEPNPVGLCCVTLAEKVLAIRAENEQLRAIVERLPLTADGQRVTVGITIYCPNGHPQQIHPSNPMSGRIYCLKGACRDEGCQGDSGSGTHYEAAQCHASPTAL